jgi:hypothetical protein
LKIAKRYTSEEFYNSLDSLILVDLLTADRRLLEKLMGEECALAFLAEPQGRKTLSRLC